MEFVKIGNRYIPVSGIEMITDSNGTLHVWQYWQEEYGERKCGAYSADGQECAHVLSANDSVRLRRQLENNRRFLQVANMWINVAFIDSIRLEADKVVITKFYNHKYNARVTTDIKISNLTGENAKRVMDYLNHGL